MSRSSTRRKRRAKKAKARKVRRFNEPPDAVQLLAFVAQGAE